MRVFHLYRQRLPAAAPQAVQILATCHAMARAGAEVTLWADGEPSETLLAAHGLAPEPGLQLRWLAPGRTLAGVEFRARLAAWALGGGVVLSRRVDYAAALLRWRRRWGGRFRVVHEWHYVASANASEAGQHERIAALQQDEATVRELADGHVTVSEALASFLGPVAAPVRVIPNGGPPPAPGARAERPTVVYAGLFRRANDLDALLGAARALPGVDVVVVGGDEGGDKLAEVRSRAADLADRVRFTGPLTPEEARAALRSASVAVATFADSVNMRHFACPLKILEAQAAGVPLVVSDFPTVRELVGPESAVLVPPGDGEALAAGIRRVNADPELAGRLAGRGLERAAERTWEQRGRRLLAFFAEIA